jgi:hypothetical protein
VGNKVNRVVFFGIDKTEDTDEMPIILNPTSINLAKGADVSADERTSVTVEMSDIWYHAPDDIEAIPGELSK